MLLLLVGALLFCSVHAQPDLGEGYRLLALRILHLSSKNLDAVETFDL